MNDTRDLPALMSILLDKSELSFNDAVAISGIDARQLRNGLDRGSLQAGEKLRVGRWAFTLRDCFKLHVIAQLTARTWTPISVAADVAGQIAPYAHTLFENVYAAGAELARDGRTLVLNEIVAFQGARGLRVVLHKRGGDEWGFYEMDGRKIELTSWQAPHIRIPVTGFILSLMHNYSAAMGEELPPGIADTIDKRDEVMGISGPDEEPEA